MKKIIFSLGFIVVGLSTVMAQTTETVDVEHFTKTEEYEITDDSHVVLTNPLKSNWFVNADAGVSAYWGDCPVGKFSNRLSPQFNVGFGKWIVPGVGVSLQFTGMDSRGDKGVQGLYTRGSDTYYDANGNPYWKEKIKWSDLSGNLMFDLTRIIGGYEGDNSFQHLNQFIVSVGIGATHHYNLPYGSANEWSGRMVLQYSRFFNAKKAISLDVKLRGLFYETKYDGVFNHQLFDENVSANIGITYYFKYRGWNRKTTKTAVYNDYHEAEIRNLKAEVKRLKNQPKDTVVIKKGIADLMDEIVVFPYLVNFVVDQVEVVNREHVNLHWVAEMIKSTPQQKYLISGYADKQTGTRERNIWLAIHRAENVFKVLTEEFGVPADQLLLSDFGGVDNMFYDDNQLSRSVIITKYEGQELTSYKDEEPDYNE